MIDLVGELTVTRVRRLTPRTVRVSFAAPADFQPWPDQQLKLCFPPGDELVLPPSDGDDMRWYQAFVAIPAESRPVMRGFTVRRHDPARGEIDVDFVLHGASGPAVRWARTAAPGQVLGRYGPSEIYRRPLPPGDWHLLAGDETAVPAIGSLLESLPATARAVVFVSAASRAEERPLTSPATVDIHWPRDSSLLDAVRSARFPAGAVSAWLAGEASVVRALRRHLVAERAVPKQSIEFTGYWRRTLTQDDAPTAEDMADAQEKLAQLRGEA
jgi:NADPH-dependent ferric siderophore reductase